MATLHQALMGAVNGGQSEVRKAFLADPSEENINAILAVIKTNLVAFAKTVKKGGGAAKKADKKAPAKKGAAKASKKAEKAPAKKAAKKGAAKAPAKKGAAKAPAKKAAKAPAKKAA